MAGPRPGRDDSNRDPADDADAARPASAVPVPPRPARGRRILWRSAQLVLGLAVGLALTELVFRWRDQGAFPHVNVYLPDPALGVRLEPGAEQSFKLRTNPRTSIRVNGAGYRGAELPAPSGEEILVVGDSQVFGLGVEETETFSARLAELTGRPVVNGGVPTYGPGEYTAVVREMLEKRSPGTVVYVINMANDLFETERPNRDRHAVWDGWAVRIETAPEQITEFPGRRWLMARSHAIYALRRWQHGEVEPVDRGFASEGTWKDLVHSGAQAGELHVAARAQAASEQSRRAQLLEQLEFQLLQAEVVIEERMFETIPELYGDNGLRLQAATASPGDIVSEQQAEEGRAVRVTAAMLQAGVRYRHQLLQKVAREAEEAREEEVARASEGIDPEEKDEEQKENEENIGALLYDVYMREDLQEKHLALYGQGVSEVRVPSVLEPRIREVKELCDAHGASLVVVALPIDVQVSAGEWAKYGVAEKIDMTPTRVLLADLVASAESLGARAIDVTDALAAVAGKEPAFLDGDIHMTAAGHRAVAEALAAKLAEPPPPTRPEPGMPAGRTRVPPPRVWRTSVEATVPGSTKAGCLTHLIGEWLRVTCLRQGAKQVPTGIEIERGGHGEAMIVVTGEAATLVAPILEGDELQAVFHWKARSRTLVARWPEGAARPSMKFEDRPAGGKPLVVSEAASKLCACYEQVYPDKQCKVDADGYAPDKDCRPTCASMYGQPSDACMAAYADDCARLEACARGEPGAEPPCPAGHANLATTGQCVALCSEARPCAAGTCTPYQGTHVCR
jgi:hypothetical protein